VQDVFERFLTTELTTIDALGQPITWPVTPYYERAAPCIDVTTGPGNPKKADDASANPLVSLLFSDPTGSGLSSAPMVLIQGSAHVDDKDLAANRKRYARESVEKLPRAAKRRPPQFVQQLLKWRYARIYIHIAPERVYVWPGGDAAAEPRLYDAHMEEVRSGHSEEPRRFHATPAGGASTWDRRVGELGTRFSTAVLSLVSPDGFPFAVRLPVRVDEAQRWIRIEGAPTGIPFQSGLACLTAHSHSADFRHQRGLQVRGDLVPIDEGWALIPHELVGGTEKPTSRLAVLRTNAADARRVARTARREFARRT